MLIVGVALILSQFTLLTNGQSQNNCEFQETCEACIQELDCNWCTEPSPIVGEKHPVQCRSKNYTTTWCQTDVVSPKMEFEILQNNEFSNDIDNPTQIKPQRVKLSLRKGEKYELKFNYKIAANYPVDLYYIMDLSKSMEKHKEKLGRLGKKLAETMINITTNFRLGFGSFIDKTELPFVSTAPKRLMEPCSGCAPPYSFKHNMNLSSDYSEFTKRVNAERVSGNLDTPEGTLDALMQAIVCKKKIQWRDKARHLIVLSTDADFHIAGDGKLAGVVEPNNGKCHDDEKDFLIYDFPSVSHINYVAKENNINIIFAIVNRRGTDILNAYKKLKENIENSNFGVLDENDADNIITLIVENYHKIVQSVKFTSNVSNEVDLKFSSSCNSNILGNCENAHVGDLLEFKATIQPRICPPNGEYQQTIIIQPEAVNESLIVELNILCDCPCSLNASHNSEKCNSQGDLKCGVCSCSPGRFGRNCECDSSSGLSEDTSRCMMEGSNEICSGMGECKCGKCECYSNPNNKEERVYGDYCQCNNYSCKKEGGKLCSGKGTCNCNVCECQGGYSGDACQCEESEANCINPATNLKCSGHGDCVCGQCVCKADKNRYSGKYCDDCISCPAQRCEELHYCVECQAYKRGKYNRTCSSQCTAFSTIIVDRFDSEDDPNIKKCRLPDDDRCIIHFEYYYENEELIVTALKERDCPKPPNVLAWILGVIGTILLAGLIMLLVWKVCTTIHDRREYVKFEKEREALKWQTSENPLYKQATTTFANPAFNRSSSRVSFRKQ